MASTPIFSTGGGGPGFCCLPLGFGVEEGAQVTKVFFAMADRAKLTRVAAEGAAPLPIAALIAERGAADLAREKREDMTRKRGNVCVCVRQRYKVSCL